MPRPPRVRRLLTALAAGTAALLAAGCVSMPSGGPVLSNPITQGTGAQNQPYVQVAPQPPGKGWSPQDIVEGFLTASASFGDNSEVAKEYLTPRERTTWNPLWSAIVYKNGPNVVGWTQTSAKGKSPETATVQVTGQQQAKLTGHGSYSVPSPSASPGSSDTDQDFTLVRTGGQWRISSAPKALLLTTDSFNSDYQLRNLYFLDPTGKFLVPDPVYVPVQAGASELMTGLVDDLIAQPPDWLSGGATYTAIPAGSKIASVTFSGVTAIVNLTGTIASGKVSDATLEKVSAQLFWTLTTQSGGTGQPAQSIELELNGHPWPGGGQNNALQRQSTINPPTGASPVYYYIDGDGYLVSRTGQGAPDRISHIGTGYQQIAISPDGTYLAALRGSSGTLYTGLVHGSLTKQGSGYGSISFDPSDNLWAGAGAQVFLFRATPSSREPLGQRVAVQVNQAGGTNVSLPITALRVAPDGVRVAIITGTSGDELTLGAISGVTESSPSIALSQIQMSPVDATSFTGVSWYGPDNVITLAAGPVAREYPVNGGTTQPITVEPGMQSISASWKNVLIAALSGGHVGVDVNLTGSWTMLQDKASAPTYPG